MDNGLNGSEYENENVNTNNNGSVDENEGGIQSEGGELSLSDDTLQEGIAADEPEKKKKHGIIVAFFIGIFKFLWWIIRLIGRLLRLMWRWKKTSLVILTMLALAVAVLIMVRCMHESDSPLNLEVGVNQGIDKTPTLLTEVRKIGQWEFLSITDEEMVDTVRKGIFSDDELTRIYYGTLRLGLDFSQCEEGWVSMDGDSLVFNLPPVHLLDENFLDETRTQSFIENGEWSGADRQAMAERAKEAMRRRCLTEENLALAQQNAEAQLRAFFQKIIESK